VWVEFLNNDGGVTNNSGRIGDLSVLDWDVEVGPHQDLRGGVEVLGEVLKGGFSQHIYF
jgi:hypothetical protein